MKAATSLRLRLAVIILGPLLCIALLAGLWQWRDAQRQAAALSDKSLLITAIAVASDVARSGGDALSLETRDLLAGTSGGPVFYHAYAPDGLYVTGFATPPVRQAQDAMIDQPIQFYTSTYYGQQVRALRLRNVTNIGGLSGTFTFTVWQDNAARDALSQSLTLRVFAVIAVLIGTVALVVWFGISIGLRPLTDLEDAISRRSSDDLSPIRRAVPPEARGVVARLNFLLGQVQTTMTAQTTFISNAAHQLRNPIAAVLAMAEAVRSAPTPQASRARVDALLVSARHVKDLANKLLTLERAQSSDTLAQIIDLGVLVGNVVASHIQTAHTQNVTLTRDTGSTDIQVRADPVMLGEALANLIDNALKHGGADLRQIDLRLCLDAGMARLDVVDDGIGMPMADIPTALARFGQAGESQGAGLGLSIADAVVRACNGKLEIVPGTDKGLRVTLWLPLAGT